MMNFNSFRNSIHINESLHLTEDIGFGDNLMPLQGTMDGSNRPVVYIEKGHCTTPVSEDFAGFPDINPDLTNKHQHDEDNDEFDDWHNNPHDADHVEEKAAKLHDHQKTGPYDPNNADHNAIASYTDESYPLNTRLYKSHLSGNPDTRKLKMDTALEKHKLPEDTEVYSGTSFDPGKIASKHKDNHLFLPAYTSTSLKKSTSMGFAQSVGEAGGMTHHHIIKFNLKRGQPGMYVGHDHNVEPHEQISHAHFNEHEFIMPRNTTVKIHPQPKILHDHENNRKYHVWDAHVVNENS